MKYAMLVILIFFGSGCAMRNPVTDSPRYAGARGASGETGGWYATISGEGESAGCGVGTSATPLHGSIHIRMRTEECDLEYDQ